MFGIEHRSVEDLGQLPASLDAGTALIEVPVDRQANVELHRRLTEAAQSALASA
jgi:2-succinyl-5-enolpyruvyl-6-hydroxy-3-cyclohexene-1-carboxylate synthase